MKTRATSVVGIAITSTALLFVGCSDPACWETATCSIDADDSGSPDTSTHDHGGQTERPDGSAGRADVLTADATPADVPAADASAPGIFGDAPSVDNDSAPISDAFGSGDERGSASVSDATTADAHMSNLPQADARPVACTTGATRRCADDPSTAALGNCALGSETCAAGAWGACSIAKQASDSCIPDDDANCNGLKNEGCPCVDGATQDCVPSGSLGECRRGRQSCAGGRWGSCVASVSPKPRDCTSPLDLDCNGAPDNKVDDVCRCGAGTSQACNTHPGKDGVGVCRAGTQSCVMAVDKRSSAFGPCTGGIAPSASDSCSPQPSDGNCNGIIGDSTATSSDVNNCGTCGHACVSPAPAGSGSAACVNGSCSMHCNDSGLLCGNSCCPPPGPNKSAACANNVCAERCVHPAYACPDDSRLCGGWDFETGAQGWTIAPDPYRAWDGTFGPVTLGQSRALGAGIQSTWNSDSIADSLANLAFTFDLCGGGFRAAIANRKVHAKITLRSASPFTLQAGNATAGLDLTDPEVPATPLQENQTLELVGSPTSDAARIAVWVRVTQTWKGIAILDDVYFE